jgi:hypothetical protein
MIDLSEAGTGVFMKGALLAEIIRANQGYTYGFNVWSRGSDVDDDQVGEWCFPRVKKRRMIATKIELTRFRQQYSADGTISIGVTAIV